MQIKLNRQKVSRYFKYHERFARKMSKFSKPGRGVRLYTFVTLLSWVQVLLSVLHFFHSINAHLGLD